ncbi:MAG: pitrilysin family protein, partial [Endomicrobiia bacterium]
FKLYKLENGLTVILKQNKNLPLVSIQIWIKAGSIFEEEKNNGISHFLEHLVFKGTKNYDVRQISKIIENYGAILNAGTSKEYTMYFTDIPKEGLMDAIKILKELVWEATFPEEELEKERLVVIEEIKRSLDNPGNVLFENFNKNLFTKSNYRYKIIGTEENIKSFSRDEIIKYYKTFYQPKNMVLSICGDFEMRDMESLVNQLFSTMVNYETNLPEPNIVEEKKNDLVEIKKHTVQHTYFLFGFLGPVIDEKIQYAGEILSIILGEGRSSRLYRDLRENKQLVYEIGSGFYVQRGPSIFYISGVCERKNLDEIINHTKEEIKKIKETDVSEDELAKAKQIITTRWFFDMETVHSQAANFAWWYMFKNLDEMKSYIDNINNITVEDIKKFVSKYADYLIVSEKLCYRR